MPRKKSTKRKRYSAEFKVYAVKMTFKRKSCRRHDLKIRADVNFAEPV